MKAYGKMILVEILKEKESSSNPFSIKIDNTAKVKIISAGNWMPTGVKDDSKYLEGKEVLVRNVDMGIPVKDPQTDKVYVLFGKSDILVIY